MLVRSILQGTPSTTTAERSTSLISDASDAHCDDEARSADPLGGPSFPPLLFVPPAWVIALAVATISGLVVACTVGKEECASLLGMDTDAFVALTLELASIPLVSLVFTYVHIWLALFMTFYPAHYVGCLRVPGTNLGLGWQGIVPFKRVKFALRATHLMTSKLVRVDEMLMRIKPESMTHAIGVEYLDALSSQALQAAVSAGAPKLWEWQPNWARQLVLDRAKLAGRKMVAAVLTDLQAAAREEPEVFSLNRVVLRVLEPSPKMTSLMFIKCGWPELEFIRNTGAVMGMTFGLVQMGLWLLYKHSWTLPTFGALVGALTNWLAMLLIFRPHHPVSLCPSARHGCCCCCCCCRRRQPQNDVESLKQPKATPRCVLQGRFIQHQAAVAATYASIVARRIVTPRRVLEELTSGRAGAKVTELARLHSREAADISKLLSGVAASEPGIDKDGVDSTSGSWSTRVGGLAGLAVERHADKHAAQEAASAVVADHIIEALMRAEGYVGEALQLEETLRERITRLPPDEFEDILHSVFKEDEWKLVALGGLLGFAVGIAQAYAFG